MVVKRNAYSVFVGKAEWKRTLEKPTHRWEGNITVDLKYSGRAHPSIDLLSGWLLWTWILGSTKWGVLLCSQGLCAAQFQHKATVTNTGNGGGPHKVFYCFRIPPDLRSVVYCSAVSNGGEGEWNFLWDQYKKSDVSTDQVLILSALGCTNETDLLNR